MNIRSATQRDEKNIMSLVTDAFKGTEYGYQGEAELVQKIRQEQTYNNELELICELDKEIVGHGLLSECWVKNEKESFTGLALAPLSVHTNYQKQGIGSQLISELERRAVLFNYHFIVILGSPDYYSKFGYRATCHYKISSPFDVPEDFFMIKELEQGALDKVTGTVYYSKAFN